MALLPRRRRAWAHIAIGRRSEARAEPGLRVASCKLKPSRVPAPIAAARHSQCRPPLFAQARAFMSLLDGARPAAAQRPSLLRHRDIRRHTPRGALDTDAYRARATEGLRARDSRHSATTSRLLRFLTPNFLFRRLKARGVGETLTSAVAWRAPSGG